MNNLSHPTAVTAAQAIITDLHITDPAHIEIEKIAAVRNAFVKEGFIKGSTARLVREGSVAFITIDEGIREDGKKRFAIAHELGHFELHNIKNQIAYCTDEMFLDWYKSLPEEPEANAFAAELLMPVQIFKKYCKGSRPSFDEIRDLAEVFQTTLTATAIRYVDYALHPCVLVVSENKIVKWLHWKADFPYRIIKKGTKIGEYSCAYDFFTKGEVPPKPESVSGDTWLEDCRFGRNLVLYEHAVPLPFYNTVLSLIWVHEN